MLNFFCSDSLVSLPLCLSFSRSRASDLLSEKKIEEKKRRYLNQLLKISTLDKLDRSRINDATLLWTEAPEMNIQLVQTKDEAAPRKEAKKT